ncbi:hypothetical protein EAO15_00070 [Klebsiella pneumoniae]|nr:hypothetical protein EAO15_00070 [Klebsiella pneumoniae]
MDDQSRQPYGWHWLIDSTDRMGALPSPALPLMLNEGLLTLHEGNSPRRPITLAIWSVRWRGLQPPPD